jgi:hypothetical protein
MDSDDGFRRRRSPTLRLAVVDAQKVHVVPVGIYVREGRMDVRVSDSQSGFGPAVTAKGE